MEGRTIPHFVLVLPASSSPSPPPPPQQYVIFCHGILGSGSNWRTFARRLVERLPNWGVVLVDLREHGASRGLPPPHTLAAAAEDLRRIEPTLDAPVTGILGHSFGGKVALSWTALRQEAGLPPQQVVVVDSLPGPRLSEVGNPRSLPVIATLKSLPRHFPTRSAFVDAIIGAGHDAAIAQWLAMNVERAHDGEGFRFALDLEAISALLDDYFTQDCWPVLDRSMSSPETRLTFVLGGRSQVVPGHERERMFAAAEQHPAQVSVRVVAEAGHWVHADAPEALLDIVVDTFSPRPDVHRPVR